MKLISRMRSEYAYLTGAIRTLRRLKPIVENKTRIWPDGLEDLADRFGDRPALLSRSQNFSYSQLFNRANQYARWASNAQIKKGDVVALLMPNCPEFLAVWTGIARAGGVTALLNTNLRGTSLAHCINIVSPKHLIIDAALADAFADAEKHLDYDTAADQPDVWIYGDSPVSFAQAPKPLKPLLDAADTAPLAITDRPDLTTDDKCLYIYTSGTTGLPKAANINHYRVQAIMHGFSGAMGALATDRNYTCMPMYHSAGGLIATGSMLTVGGSVFIAERFSASSFWDDIVDNECTMFQYIGELCRYLVNSPPHPKERAHNIRLCNGNGLRPDIWETFRTRFELPRILEWYAATESNAVFFNFDGKVGSIGRIPKWAEHKFVTEVVRFDYETEAPKRNARGFCEKCEPNEIGEVISQILNDPKRPSQRFEGYSNRSESERKILESVFNQGDRWFRTGDLMRRDALGYFYFVDRIGDTFRWKGENVATSEVSENVTGFAGIREANVYGVAVPGMEGRAGMVAMVVEDDFNPNRFYGHVCQTLPDYARPVFLRIQNSIETTGTFKQRKVELVRQGCNPANVSEPLFMLDHRSESYVSLSQSLYEAICSGKRRL
tara:strand:+ start:2656 stop:4482 length:1827 start_codon:yes stop_codon:yes gene_type:complete